MISAVLSVGTNSTRLLVAQLNGKAQRIAAGSVVTRIGEGMRERGSLREDAMQRTLAALERFVKEARAHTGDVCAIATSALRRAENEAIFAARVRDVTGVDLEIISGEEEARRSYFGAVSGAPGEPPFTVVDPGGGSTEFAYGDSTHTEHAISCEIGAVRLTESLPQLAGTAGAISQTMLAQARRVAAERFERARALPRGRTLIFVGGTATTTVSILRGERRDFEYEVLRRSDLQSVLERLAREPLERRKAIPGMNPDRADIMLAGTVLLDAIFELSGADEAFVTVNDLLLGTLLLRRER